MSTSGMTEASYLLREATLTHGDGLAAGWQWLWEASRWRELALSLLLQVEGGPSGNSRALVEKMGNLGLLDVPALARLIRDAGGLDFDDTHARRVLAVLQDGGFDPDKARRALTALAETARGLERHFGGKIQRYLRHYGEQMLRELGNFFQFTALSDAETQDAFTFWLQNVLSMPLSLVDKHMQAFCQQHGLTTEQLVAAADELDMNLAFLDDVLMSAALKKQGSEPQVSATASRIPGEASRGPTSG